MRLINCISSVFAQNMSELWSWVTITNTLQLWGHFYIFTNDVTVLHFQFSETLPIKVGFLDQFCWRKTTPPKVSIRARPQTRWLDEYIKMNHWLECPVYLLSRVFEDGWISYQEIKCGRSSWCFLEYHSFWMDHLNFWE